ncbi:Holliday junction branch migration protein RuvA [Lacticaseibacillus manihotivorans]|jgi:Holliday junction DNA helicase RuvA|uniref:Holliday junction branch migration complex subunit RuvA n=2 Tax=Lacticaseibacillus manihotivorans TaxID=88233 RepID=A0A0R1Q4T5_9LACO|nr:Holliday junction branch migration protein RuvA [Lacticaseibacillus manihotivorans]KRL39607.1 Holliday junction DNA helicase RuvA [Lacticaseibacillus manihotivorans DSM 13343 = JCM 12514]QFQ90471.1 Holliday junction branch migration protein RuvA [Lacticaseibacillus manihotivorans]
MYEFMQGRIAAVTPSFIVINVNGIGYRLLVANPYQFDEGQEVTVYVQLIIRDNDQSMYGFADANEKQTFNQLLSVTGIGPKSALAILANASTEGLANAIAQDDVRFLTKFPGIGKKTAQQIILDLKGKIDAPGPLLQELLPQQPDNAQLADALAALVALGYPQKQVDKLAGQLENSSAKTTDAYMRLGLSLLSQ